MIKIALIRPFHPSLIGHPFEKSPPYGLYELKGYLDTYTSFQTRILDLAHLPHWKLSLAKILPRYAFDVFGITALSPSRFEAIKLARYVKKFNPQVCVVVGGVHFAHCAEDTLTHVSEIDAVVHGEGGITIIELAKAIDVRGWFGRIKGISFRSKDRIVKTAPNDYSKDAGISLSLNGDSSRYKEYVRDYPVAIPARAVMASKGCPARCIYCCNLAKIYHTRSPKDVIAEIKLIREKHGVRGINFLDCAFTADRHHLEDLCREMIDSRLDLKWWCESRADMPLELLGDMKKAGCVSLAFGLESGSQRILSVISKGITVRQIVDFVNGCNALGIYVKPFSMFSLPGEEERDAIETLNLLDEIESYPFTIRGSFQPTMIFPGTELETLARDKEILGRQFSWSTHYESALSRMLLQHPSIPIYMEKDKMPPEVLKNLYLGRASRLLASSLNRCHVVKEFSSLIKNYPSIIRYNLPYIFSHRLWKKVLAYFSRRRKTAKKNGN